MKTNALVASVFGLAAFTATTAVAPVASATDESIAVYVEGMGGSQTNNAGDSAGALGVQAGVQLFFLEAYASQTAFSGSASVTRAVLGPFFDIDVGKWELSLHLGVGGIRDSGGVLLGNDFSGPQTGGVARLGLALDRDLGDFFAIGASLYTEGYAVRNEDTKEDWTRGSSVLLSGHLRFELGI
ncbi:MAG: hypothetical protein SF187_20220 [Deltaproteobacteria bacterium]|nr:hypothetical protein [Deltaproteobacteria bacterium]